MYDDQNFQFGPSDEQNSMKRCFAIVKISYVNNTCMDSVSPDQWPLPERPGIVVVLVLCSTAEKWPNKVDQCLLLPCMGNYKSMM